MSAATRRPVLSGHALRERFLRFFEAQKHLRVASDSLVPREDPTVLFTSAGMNQFKDYFLGKRKGRHRATSCQKCLRIGDLDNILKLQGHHTFFEMLGNFSFGDYFKREAITWGWEFLTGTLDHAGRKKSQHPELCLSLSPDELWVSVYADDEEAAGLWRKHIGVPESKIKRFGAEDNFWPANAPAQGPNGPCGPCSEIYVHRDGKDLEIWNLVFTQFDRQDDGRLASLPKPNIDTGMGLERLAQVVQQKRCDYETDLFVPIVERLQVICDVRAADLPYVYAVADHIRAAVFLIGDGVMPGNGSREYVLRMLVRRALRYGVRKLKFVVDEGGDESFVGLLVEPIFSAMCNNAQSPYRELLRQETHIETVLRREEEAFLGVIDEGTARAQELLSPLRVRGITIVPGEIAFKLYDTFGLPMEVTEDIAQELQFTGIDHAGFQALLKEQQERSRAASQFGGEVFATTYQSLIAGHAGASAFVGYDALESAGTVTALFHQQAPVQQASEGQQVDVILDRTPFYGESGGQVGDTGRLVNDRAELEVVNTQHAGGAIVHTAKVLRGRLAVGDVLTACVDAVRRLHIARNHTATHMLHSVLREVLGAHVQQRGSLVAPDRLRFDFTQPKALDEATLTRIELEMNRRIMQDAARRTEVMDVEAAKQTGALAFFGDKYDDEVRVVTIGHYSKELCGGTHLERTGQVGPCKIVAERSIAAGVRRIEAVTGERAAQLIREESVLLDRLARSLSRSREQLTAAIDELLAKQRALEKTVSAAKTQASLGQLDALAQKRQERHGIGIIAESVGHVEVGLLRQMADRLRTQLTQTAVLLAATDDTQKISLILALTDDLVQAGADAGQLVKPIAQLMGGSGGGRKDLAQAGGKDAGQLQEVLARAPELVAAGIRR